MERPQKELLKSLEAMAFYGKELEQEVASAIHLNLPRFRVKHHIPYGTESMFFDLYFKRNPAMGSYELEKFNATHRASVDVDYGFFKGIDTYELEQQMKEINWQQYFLGQSDTNVTEADVAGRVINVLNFLLEEKNFDANVTAEKLMFKYWPEEVYIVVAQPSLKPAYEHSREFTVANMEVCTAHLAYHILSGRLDDLYEKIRHTGIDPDAGIRLEGLLQKELSSNPESFVLKFHCNSIEGYSSFVLPVSMDQGWYSINEYELSFSRYPVIQHTIVNGVDTSALEVKMRAVAWHKDNELFIFYQDREPEFQPAVSEIVRQMNLLGQSEEALTIYNQLQLKFWTDPSFFDGLVTEAAWDYLDSLPKRTMAFGVEMPAPTARNLLCGRAVMEKNIIPYHEQSDDWLRLDLEVQPENNKYPYKPAGSLSLDSIKDIIVALPIFTGRHSHIADDLALGSRLLVENVRGPGLYLQANPQKQTLDLFTLGLRPIPVNVFLDPDWRPENNDVVYYKRRGTDQKTDEHQNNRRKGPPRL